MRAKAATSAVTFGDWLGLYLTGLLLAVFLAAHLWAVHYAASGQTGLSFAAVQEKLRSPLFFVLDLGMLCLVFYHGLVGLRRVIVDLEILGERGTRIITWALVVIGLAGLYDGWAIYRSFVG
ncbi:MAG: hypothetical protein HYX94_01615 [Chloroflexi bacterium]|nr:hypothetical protein [Chloroflexota bacterium]